MLRDPENANAPTERGASGAAFGDGLHHDDNSLSRERAWQLLLHACDVLTCAATVLLSGDRIGQPGRELLTYTAIRIRQIREVLG